MTARLISFQYEPRGTTGWTSPRLEFGKTLTAVVSVDNGAGKTPVMKGIMAALGHEVSLDPDIVRNCSRARLHLHLGGRSHSLVRELGVPFEIHVESGSEKITFTDQAKFSSWLLEEVGIQQRALTSIRRESTPIYLNVLFPLLWVDQDSGWTSLYVPPEGRNFVQDQYAEMLRVILGLPPRHPFRSRDDYDQAKRRLADLERHIATQRFLVNRLRSAASAEVVDEGSLRQRREQLRAELAANEQSLDAMRSLTQRHDEVIEQLSAMRSTLVGDHSALLGRERQLDLALKEIDGEVEVLGANVQANELLNHFICGREDCKLFQPHAESYGRTLLFLKDQMKDLRSADGSLAQEIRSLEQRVARLDGRLAHARSERKAAVTASPHAQVHARIEAVTKELIDVELVISKLEQLAQEAVRFERSLDEREQQVHLVEKLKPRGEKRDEGAVFDARQALAQRMEEWIETLRTPNLPRDISVDENFDLVIRGEVFSRDSSISGSTRTRVVLAFHAALLETSLDLGGNHPGWLFLDAPKQHELTQADLNAYFGRLSELAHRYPNRVQAVFSAANTDIPLSANDVEWRPTYGTGRNAKYLWPADKLGSGS